MSMMSDTALGFSVSTENVARHDTQKYERKKFKPQRRMTTSASEPQRPVTSLGINKKDVKPVISCTRRNICKNGISTIETETLKSCPKKVQNKNPTFSSKEPIVKVIMGTKTSNTRKMQGGEYGNRFKEQIIVTESSHDPWELPMKTKISSSGATKRTPKPRIQNINKDILAQKRKLRRIPQLKNVPVKKRVRISASTQIFKRQISLMKTKMKNHATIATSNSNIVKTIEDALKGKVIAPPLKKKTFKTTTTVQKINQALPKSMQQKKKTITKHPSNLIQNTTQPDLVNGSEAIIKSKPTKYLNRSKLPKKQGKVVASISDAILSDINLAKVSHSNNKIVPVKHYTSPCDLHMRADKLNQLILKPGKQAHPILTIVDKLTTILKQIENVLNEETNYSTFIREKMEVLQNNLQLQL